MKHRRVEWGDGPPARPGLSLGRLSVSAPAQRYHWFWLGLCLAATVVAAQGVRLEMLAASRSDLSRYCDSLDQAFLHRIEEPGLEFRSFLAHSRVYPSLVRASEHLERGSSEIDSVWQLDEAGAPGPVWRRGGAEACPPPADERLAEAVAALEAQRNSGVTTVVVGSGVESRGLWLLGRGGSDRPLVLAGVSLDGLVQLAADRLSPVAAGEVSLQVGPRESRLLELPETEAVDPAIAMVRGFPAYDGGVMIRYRLRPYADAWSVLRPVVSGGVLILGTVASSLLFVLVRMLCAARRRQARLTNLGDDLRRRDREIEHRRALAEAASAAKSDLLARTSHNMRSPLTSILGITEVLLAEAWDEPGRAQLQTVRSSAAHLLALANSLLEIARAESGRVSPRTEAVDPGVLLTDSTECFRERAVAAGLSLSVAWEGVTPATITTDPTRLREILTNLVDNAVRHTDRGGVGLTARVEPGAEQLTVEVIDSGPGISPERIETLFQRDDTRPDFSPDRGLHGLGLSITRDLTSAMGGTIDVVSRVGMGTIVTVRLPVGPITWRSNTTPVEPPPARATVMVVDDAAEIRQFMRLALGNRGLGVHLAASAEEALAAAEQPGAAACRVVFVDQQLGRSTGVALLAGLRERLPGASFVALTGDTGSGAERRYLDAGFDAYLAKPFAPEQLSAILGRLGREGKARAA